MLESLPVRPEAGVAAQVGVHVLQGCLQSVQPVVQDGEIRFSHDDLARRDL